MVRILFVLILLCPSAVRADGPPSFLNDVMPVFTKVGCNSGTCHGKGVGQNGFRMSLRGYAPEQDHQWIVREFVGRRVSHAAPDQSLLLLKASGRTSHGGGRVLDPAGTDYDTLRRWIAAGTPGPNAKDPKLTKLTLTPGRTLKVNEPLTLSATAHWSDGSTTDVTRLACWDANDATVLSVNSTAEVRALRPGATAVRAAFLSEVAAASFAVPFDGPDTGTLTSNNFIDDHINRRLTQLRIAPSPTCDDGTFLRRAMLDTIGTLPTPEEVRTFLADSRTDKRARLVDALLERPEFNQYWTLFLSDLLQNRKERDHDVRGVAGVHDFHAWLYQQMTARRGWDAISRDVLLAKDSAVEHPAVGYFIVTVGEHRETEKSEVAESVAQTFLGTRIGCARCHNHPLEKYTQDDFYQFSAYFTRIQFERGDLKKNKPTILRVSAHDPKQNDKPVQVRQPRTGKMLPPQTLDRDVLPTKGSDPRAALVDWIIANPSFRGAMANRLWKHFLSVGLVEPVDDLRATNPPTNPALFSALGEEFQAGGYDLRHVIRLILNSQTYQRASDTTEQNASESRFYSHYYARRLPAEVLLDAVSSATGVPEAFTGYPPGWRAIQIADPVAASPFLKTFGSSDRTTACACERAGDVTLPQALTLLNGDRIPLRLQSKQGIFQKLITKEKDNTVVLEELFLRTFSRPPTPAERDAVMALLKTEHRNAVFHELMWALMNSKEFVFNH